MTAGAEEGSAKARSEKSSNSLPITGVNAKAAVPGQKARSIRVYGNWCFTLQPVLAPAKYWPARGTARFP